MKGKVSIKGYKENSPDKNNDFNVILSNKITMKGVRRPVLGIDNLGNTKMMLPGEEHEFPGDKVLEIPFDKKDLPFFMKMGGIPCAQKGGFIAPKDAKVVNEISSDHKVYGTDGNRTYYVKDVALPDRKIDPKNSKSGKPDPEKYKQYLIQQLQSGVTPEALIKSGLTSKEVAESLSTYYKPQFVYTEIKPGKPIEPVQKKIPLQESDRIEMKQIFPPNGGKYMTFQMPDPNAGYNKNTEVYYDPKTFRQIDPTKSFDNVGNYSPSYIYSDPSQGTLDEKYRGTKIMRRNDESKIGQADSLNTVPDIKGATNRIFQTGGTVDKTFFSQFLADYFDEAKNNEAPQGEDTDSYIAAKKDYLTKLLRSNAIKNLISSEIQGVKEDVSYKAQMGMQTGDQINPPDQNNSFFNYYTGPFGPYGGAGVQANTSDDQPYFLQPGYKPLSEPEIKTTQPMVYPDQQKQLLDRDAIIETNQEIEKAKRAQKASLLVDTAKFSMDVFSRTMEANRDKKYQKQLSNTVYASQNIFSTLKGSRGDYEINSGAFRPDQMTPIVYKQGGQYTMDDKEIDRLKRLGYDIEIVE